MQIYSYFYRIHVKALLAGQNEKIFAGVFSMDTPITQSVHVQYMLENLSQKLNIDPAHADLTALSFLGGSEIPDDQIGRMDA
jgi:hypothetical protein